MPVIERGVWQRNRGILVVYYKGKEGGRRGGGR
jgi:hypothetical protein